MTKHTPGPWNALGLGSEGYWIISGDDIHNRMIVAQVTGGTWKEIVTNARLIAAAPDMLDALILAVEWLSGEHGDGPIGVQSLAEIKQAIAKAQGD